MTGNFSVGWRQVWACLVLMAAVGMIAMTYGILAVPLAQEFKPSRMVLMLAMTIMAGTTAVLSPWLGNLMDRVSLRMLMVAGAVMLAAGFFVLSFAASIIHVLVIYGIFMAPANVLLGPIAATVLLSRWFVKQRGTAMGLAIAGIAAGGFVFPYLIQWLLDNFHWREAVRLLALVLATLTVPAALLVVNRPGDRGLHPDGAESDPEAASAGPAAPPLSAKAILSDPTFWLFGLIFAIAMSGLKGMITNLGPLVTDEGIDAAYAAYLVMAYAAAGFIAKLVFAAVADKLNPRTLIIVGLAGFGLGMACMIKADAGVWFIAAGVALAGFFGGLLTPMQSFLVPRIFGSQVVGRASGLISSFVLLFLLSTPPVFGLIFDVFGNYDAIFVTFAGLAIAVMLAVPYLRLHPRDPGDGSAVLAETPAE